MTEVNQVILSNEKATVDFGRQLGKASKGVGIIYLHGNLGAGKTTLSRGVLQHFGHQGAVKSPTYNLVESYILSDKPIYHFDFYRLQDPEELEFLGIRDYFAQNVLALIEWPEHGEGFLPKADLDIHLEQLTSGRQLKFDASTNYGKTIFTNLINEYKQ